MKALKLEGTSIREVDIENTLEALQEAVFGYIETITLAPGQSCDDRQRRGTDPWNGS